MVMAREDVKLPEPQEYIPEWNLFPDPRHVTGSPLQRSFPAMCSAPANSSPQTKPSPGFMSIDRISVEICLLLGVVSRESVNFEVCSRLEASSNSNQDSRRARFIPLARQGTAPLSTSAWSFHPAPACCLEIHSSLCPQYVFNLKTQSNVLPVFFLLKAFLKGAADSCLFSIRNTRLPATAR